MKRVAWANEVGRVLATSREPHEVLDSTLPAVGKGRAREQERGVNTFSQIGKRSISSRDSDGRVVKRRRSRGVTLHLMGRPLIRIFC